MKAHPHFRPIAVFMVMGLLLFSLGQAQAQNFEPPAAPNNGEITIPPGDPVEIAVAMFYGWSDSADFFDAVQMAMDDFGPIKGFDLQRNDYDSGCSQPEGDTVGAAIVANIQNAAVVGPFCSSSTAGAAPHFETAVVPMISPSNTLLDLYVNGPTIFNRMVIPDPEYTFWNALVGTLPSASAWQADFESRFGRQPTEFANFAYDSATLLLTRIKEVSKLDGSGNLVIDRAKLATAVRNTFNFPGVTGKVSFDMHGDRIDTFHKLVWDDQFSEPTLNEQWSFMEEDPTHWSLTDRPGFLRIITQQEPHNRLFQAIPEGDLTIRTRLLFTPTENYQFGGLVVYGDDDNFLQFGRAYCDAPQPACVGNGIYFDHVEGGIAIGSSFATGTTTLDEAYLLLERVGDDFTAYVSENGNAWTEVGTHTIGFDPVQIGVWAGNQSQPVGEIPADIDFFILEQTNQLVYLPVVERLEKVGQQLSVSDSGSQTFPEYTPFHIVHGWSFDGTEENPELFDFQIQLDGVYLDEDIIEVKIGESRYYVYNFPDGMTGVHTVIGHWLAPCGMLFEVCVDPDEIVEGKATTVEVTFFP